MKYKNHLAVLILETNGILMLQTFMFDIFKSWIPE